MVKIIFSDMDDTFLASDKSVPAGNIRMLEEAEKRGILFVPCTGRNVNGIPSSLTSFSNVRYAVCCNGALVAEVDTGRIIHEIDVDKEEIHGLFAEIGDQRITFDLFADGRVYTAEDRWRYLDEIPVTEATRAHIKEVRTCYHGSVDEMIDAAGSICRINVFYLDDAGRDSTWAAVDSRPDLTRASSQPCNVEITHKDADKGTGLVWLCNYLDIPVADSIAFGDSSNDTPMLIAAGDGVAVANALPSCCAASDHRTLSNEEGGVGRYILGLPG
jgi:Cof subfamily protein (haloacid dehalogenase superfamily)